MKSRERCTFLAERFATTFQTRFKSWVHETALTRRGWPKARGGCRRRSTPKRVSTRWLVILVSEQVFCSQFCSQPDGLNSTQWTRYEYMQRQNCRLNSIAV